jgi:hypothetical protein
MTKKIWTAQEAIDRVQVEMDTEEETFIEESEYLQYINDAIDEAEAEIHSMNEDYFLTSQTLDLVAGTRQYALPTNIYANKLKLVQWKRSSADMRKMGRIKVYQTAWAEELTDPDPQSYLIRNDGTTDGVEIEFYPTPQVTETAIITLWYLRNAERVAATTDLIDIPEFGSFVFAYLKWRVATKEMSPLLPQYNAELEGQRALMKQTLSDMIVDEEETLPQDVSFYEDFDRDFEDYW